MNISDTMSLKHNLVSLALAPLIKGSNLQVFRDLPGKVSYLLTNYCSQFVSNTEIPWIKHITLPFWYPMFSTLPRPRDHCSSA